MSCISNKNFHPFFSSYYNCVPPEDFDLLQYLAWGVVPSLTVAMAGNWNHIQRKFHSSTTWCHLAARAFAAAFADKGIEVIDGQYIDIVFDAGEPEIFTTTHSWCRTVSGSILDVAPVGVVSFSPILYARSEGVKDTTCGYVMGRYHETRAVKPEIQDLLRENKFRESFSVYVSLLKSARKDADRKMLLRH